MSHFRHAIEIMEQENCKIFGPTSFQNYLKDFHIHDKNTARYISINAYSDLDKELRENNIMVFRLGASTSNNTQFVLVKPKKPIFDEYFLDDEQIFQNSKGNHFIPEIPLGRLLVYSIPPVLSETSLVGLGLVSGLVGSALHLEDHQLPLYYATGQSTYSFQLKLHNEMNNIFTHYNGQVEVDALFIGQRNGATNLFVIEAKSSLSTKSVAKHKLVYPILSLADKVPKEIHIIPVYLKIRKLKTGIHYHIVECSFPDPRIEIRAINELKVVKHTHLILSDF